MQTDVRSEFFVFPQRRGARLLRPFEVFSVTRLDEGTSSRGPDPFESLLIAEPSRRFVAPVVSKKKKKWLGNPELHPRTGAPRLDILVVPAGGDARRMHNERMFRFTRRARRR